MGFFVEKKDMFSYLVNLFFWSFTNKKYKIYTFLILFKFVFLYYLITTVFTFDQFE